MTLVFVAPSKSSATFKSHSKQKWEQPYLHTNNVASGSNNRISAQQSIPYIHPSRQHHFRGGGGFRGFLAFAAGLISIISLPLTFTTFAVAAGVAPAFFFGSMACAILAIWLGHNAKDINSGTAGIGHAGFIMGCIDLGLIACVLIIGNLINIGKGNGTGNTSILNWIF